MEVGIYCNLYVSGYFLGLQELVTKVFQQMWFTPVRDADDESRLKSVIQMTDVVSLLLFTKHFQGELLFGLPKNDLLE